MKVLRDSVILSSPNSTRHGLATYPPHVHNGGMEEHTGYFREWRKHVGMTLEQVSEVTGLAINTISRIERGSINYSRSSLESLASAYGCTPGQILDHDPTDIEIELGLIFRDVPEEDQPFALKSLSGFRKKSGTDH